MSKEKNKVQEEDKGTPVVSKSLEVDYPLTRPAAKARKERLEKDENNEYVKPEPTEAPEVDNDVDIIPPDHGETKDDVDPKPGKPDTSASKTEDKKEKATEKKK